MDNRQQIIKLVKQVAGQSNVLTIPRVFIDILDRDIITALLLGQIVYWSDRGRNGWFYKSYKEWLDEIGLSQYQASRAATKLQELGIIQTKKRKVKGAPTTHYFLDTEKLTDLIIKFLDNQVSPLSKNLENQDYQETQQSLTETITETKNLGETPKEESKKKKEPPKPPETVEEALEFIDRYTKTPEDQRIAYKGYGRVFLEAVGLPFAPFFGDRYGLWAKTFSIWWQLKATPADISLAVKQHRNGDASDISGPQSINYKVRQIVAQRQAGLLDDGYTTFHADRSVNNA